MGEPSVSPRRVQFSLRFLLGLMTSLALLCGFATLLPIALSQLVIGAIWILAASVLLTGLVFGKGDERAFCIGAVVALSSMWTGLGGRFMMGVHSLLSSLLGGLDQAHPIVLWFDLGVHVLLVFLNGWLCIRARAWFERDQIANNGANSGD